jgi:nitroreductase
MIHAMNVTDAIAQRRSIKKSLDRPVARDEVEFLLDAAVLAPNHHLTQPWRFYVLGPEARRSYGAALGDRKAKKVQDAEAANAVRLKTATEHHDLPGLIAVAMVVNENPEAREEDYAAVMQAIANITLAAVERGLGTHIRTGAVMDDPAARRAIGVKEGERIIAMLSVGVPAEVPTPRPRQAAASVTTWMP